MVSWEVIYKATVFIAEEMGVALKRSALSPNIRERVDLSCAVLDADGAVVAQAEHIPVHLGSFRVGVFNLLRWLSENGIDLEEGDMVAVNDPYIAGTHLNDVMLLAPVYYQGKLIGYVVSKAHHVDIGGPVPGSINPTAKTLYEEGLVIPPIKLVKKHVVDSELLRFIASNTKTPQITVGDLYAQIAANNTGVKRVLELVEKYGLSSVLNSWKKAVEHARTLTLYFLSKWASREAIAEDYVELSNGDAKIRVRVRFKVNGVEADFAGSSPQVSEPLNAVYGVTFAATAYAVRAFIGEEVPTNEGFYSVLEVKAPPGTIVNPVPPAPVSGGNLETSQRIADTVLRALAEIAPDRVSAAGSGTMMNIMVGGYCEELGYWSYYETVGGGTGGRPSKDGVSGVHVNMTNTMNTPIEVAERLYPLLFTKYTLREGSGGKGLYRGGDGVVRAFKVLKPAKIAVLADRFRHPPYGLKGGEPGKTGCIIIVRSTGQVEVMPSKFTTDLNPNDEVVVETPGGGGWGSPSSVKS